MDIDKMQLPEVNQRRHQSTARQSELKTELMLAIENFQNEKSYLFDPLEVNNVLLEMIQKNHESYFIKKFGYKTV